jgi:serine protease Do
MKQIFLQKLLIAALLLMAVPSSLFAQKEKEKEKDKSTGYQQIIISRNGDKDEKTVIEINGDKVKINGKDAADNKDVRVRVNTMKGTRVFATAPRAGTFSFEGNGNGFNFFNEDPNRPMLGIVTEGKDKGAEVQTVSKESAAEKAGLKKGDIITRIDNKKIESSDDVTEAVRSHKPGEKINIHFLRDGKEQNVTAELGKWKGIELNGMEKELELQVQKNLNGLNPPQPPMVWRNGELMMGGRPRLGMSVQDMEDGKGVKVLDIDENSNAAKAGIQKNDIITEIDGVKVNSADEVSRMVRQKAMEPSVHMQVLRNGKTQTIEIKTPRKLKTVDL